MFRRGFNYYFAFCYCIMGKLKLPSDYDYLDVSQENDEYIFRIKQIKDEPSSTAPLKPELFGRKRHEMDSPNLGGHFPHTPCYNFRQGTRKWAAVGKGNWIPLPRLSPKRSQNLTSPQKKPTASERPSLLLRGSF
ncbi:hypothetical protein AVEN_103787-1 [Araneus ventricosus]|uniref:Uncharacterized protein n=1 Tax=Araneus ventricosus TaxID=182803 RepID=A0A4Y2GKX6_ARAVE|nr:hypothetical protein AVEN_103787-1 [Araneus ventricosus]